jgi:hypothetical protein
MDGWSLPHFEGGFAWRPSKHRRANLWPAARI